MSIKGERNRMNEEDLKWALKTIKKKRVNIGVLLMSDNFQEYNTLIFQKEILNHREFSKLKKIITEV